jgi:hypothetical protein
MARLPQGYHMMPGAGGKTYAYYRSLPRGAAPANLSGGQFYVHNDMFYKATTYRGSRVYMVVPPPR